MSITTALYTLLIGPLELIFELIFSFAFRVLDNLGLSIIVLSLTMNFLLLPLYKQTDAIQQEAIDTEKKLKPVVDHIKKTFKGDERFMMMQTCYRQHHYKPTDALKGISPLMLEIPFFMAAYNFLSGLPLMKNASFGPISDLGAPDGMLVIGGITINLLPILMTAINLLSGLLYTKGMPLRSKIQLYGMAGIFLVLLYQSPAGLVFYWTLNNLFSLVKNIFAKFKEPGKVFSLFSSIVGIVLIPLVLQLPLGDMSPKKKVAFILMLAVFQLPIFTRLLRKRVHFPAHTNTQPVDNKLFYAGCFYVALLLGVLIPTGLIADSPLEFINPVSLQNPLVYVLNCFLQAAGLFCVWGSVFYLMENALAKKIMCLGVWIFAGIATVDYMFFGKNYGTISPTLVFEQPIRSSTTEYLVNSLVVLLVTAVMYLIWRYKRDGVKALYMAASIALIGMSAFNVAGIQKAVSDKTEQMVGIDSTMPEIPLSKNGRNVVVVMLDRAISGYVPFIFHEKPELEEKFSGFTYYPNTISYGAFTNVGTPPLYGGYEYRPEEMNARSDLPLVEKHDEALKVMPAIFNNEDYTATVFDPSYAGYDWIPDLSIYDDYPEINAYLAEGKVHSDGNQLGADRLNRNFFHYSFLKTAPTVFNKLIYDYGRYNSVDNEVNQICENKSKAEGLRTSFMNAYELMDNLPRITKLVDQENTFMMMSSNVTHEPMLLKEPEYTPAYDLDNTVYDQEHPNRYAADGRVLRMDTEEQVSHYHINVAGYTLLGKWFDWMRENGVYDNTRIILVSDHGRALNQLENMRFEDSMDGDVMFYNALLMVKDFDAKGFTTDEQFMTVADVPTLATQDIIKNATNPFTGKPITSEPKYNEKQHILLSYEWKVSVNNGNTYLPGRWFEVQDNIFDMNNWREYTPAA